MRNHAGDREVVAVTKHNSVERIGTTRAFKEEYALTEAPPTWRYKWGSLVFSLLGGGTAAVFLATPGQLAESFGVANVLVGLAAAMVIQTALNYVLIRTASDTGLGTELLSRGLGFGFYGTAWTTLLYWVSWVIFFGSEAQIMGDALASISSIPNWACYLIVGFAFVPLVLYGVGFIEKFQRWTLLLFVVGFAALITVTLTTPSLTEAIADNASGSWGKLNFTAFFGVLGAYLGFIGNVALGHTDMGRLGRNRESLNNASGNRGAFALAFIPYSFVAYVVLGVLGVVFWLATGDSNPGSYTVYILGSAGFLLILITQLRINLINAYSGSIALSNFFSRFRFVPGRNTFAIVTVALGTALAVGDVLGRLSVILTILGIFFMAWLGVLIPRLLLLQRASKGERAVSSRVEYRRALVKDYDVPGLVSVACSSVAGLTLYFVGGAGYLGGSITSNLAPIFAFLLAAALVIVSSFFGSTTSSRSADSVAWPRDDVVVECPVEHEVVATRSMVPCPFLKQWIGSPACTSVTNCGEICLSTPNEELKQIPLPARTSYLKEVNERLAEGRNDS